MDTYQILKQIESRLGGHQSIAQKGVCTIDARNLQLEMAQIKGRKKHINFFNINFLRPTQNPPVWGPEEKVYMPHFLGRNTKRHPHKLYRRDFWVIKSGVPNGPFSATKNSVYCFFPALTNASKTSVRAPKRSTDECEHLILCGWLR